MNNAVDFASLSDAEETMPVVPFLERLRKNPDLVKTGPNDFPVLSDPEVRHATGSRGRAFGAQMRKELYWDTKEQKLIGAVYFPFTCEGPPGCVHGGALATALDSCLGWTAVRGAGFGHVTLNLNTNYKKFVRLGSVVQIECKIDKRDGKKLYISGNLSDGHLTNPTIFVEATSLFYQANAHPPFDVAQQMFGPASGVTPEQLIEKIRAQKKKEKQEKKEKAASKL
eukprot:TRINITY_DN8394_c0_g1_i1.p1 TRINITY_DN8394_c0_g1~~TRINITY_DN8394_c0_g1_i1.p1  ORF type:complete len:226 (+),score=34.55 TRINITY_DN8394_c0_g1_i1:79-756(+)